jgi:phosphodiesterase/alkaline phosphatase D-like protein
MRRPMRTITQAVIATVSSVAVVIASAAQPPEWSWVGAVDDSSAVIKVAAPAENPPGNLSVSRRFNLTDGLEFAPQISAAGSLGVIAQYRLTGLKPFKLYHYGWGGAAYGRFRTLPAGRASFTVAFSSCAATGSEHPVFDEIRQHEPLFFLHLGDLHYLDIKQNDPERFRQGYHRVLGSENQNRLFRDMAVIYIWDDHDYGPNDSDRESPSRQASLAAYREVVPHYPLALGDDPDAPIAQAFSVGRVRFILTDLRSARTPNRAPDDEHKTMMGAPQLAWFKQELLRSHQTHALVVWASTVPWIWHPGARDQVDSWGNFSHERRLISDFIVAHNITNLCMVSGDAHMLAADDGSNNTFAGDGKGPAFPVFQAAALDQSGSVKGGPYTHGTFPNRGQFGLLRIEDRGAEIEVTFEGRNHHGKILLTHRFTRPVGLP